MSATSTRQREGDQSVTSREEKITESALRGDRFPGTKQPAVILLLSRKKLTKHHCRSQQLARMLELTGCERIWQKRKSEKSIRLRHGVSAQVAFSPLLFTCPTATVPNRSMRIRLTPALVFQASRLLLFIWRHDRRDRSLSIFLISGELRTMIGLE